ncbi:type I-E CRISPR-associated protein Cse1/CasA [Chitiniphilus eburneus]|uniref:Type I-E CRISPR-associated protein Cse1/CasA n=1 Tax=Chitiniphilus eburneus TaxID=2571148 RepID=A0A4U0PRT6_9NEIS|nr:type I-E CRISPR-associated protein Cse1/CasA [Chitiniphilus eburneus]TJZ70710.1 type I-E CRISPR-associated protein Cse1/CasA [Chitiniphilus eburneus]
MNLLTASWLRAMNTGGGERCIAPTDIGDSLTIELLASRPDFHGALYQFLIGLLQTTFAPDTLDDWLALWDNPPDAAILRAAFQPYEHAFHLENDGPAFMQDLQLPAEANQLPVLDLLIDAGSDSNRYFNKPAAEYGLCAGCCAQALFTLQINAPPGGRGIRTSLRGGGPLTTLLRPVEPATLWQKLWLNVLPREALGLQPVTALGDVLPWLAPTRASDGTGLDTTVTDVHPLQAYWSMPRRIRLDTSTASEGDCAVCGARGVRLIRHYRTRHGGTNYTGPWPHPLTPFNHDPKLQKPPLSVKGRKGGIAYRDWLGLALGNDQNQPAAAQVVAHFNAQVRLTSTVQLWCFGYDMDNMRARCWYDAVLPRPAIAEGQQAAYAAAVKRVLDVAQAAADSLRAQVKAAWFKRPGDKGDEPVVSLSFWQGSETAFYALLQQLSQVDACDEQALVSIYRNWLYQVRDTALALFDHWVLNGDIEEMDMERVARARAKLEKELAISKAAKVLWDIIKSYL